MITSSDLLTMLSVKTGSAGNSVAQGNPNNALGKYISTTAWAGGSLHDLFDAVSGAENAASTVDYRCIFVKNTHATLTWMGAKVWFASQVAGGADYAIGIDPAAASAVGALSAQAAEIANENAAPSGVSFSAPTSEGTALSIGDLAPGQCRAIWIRRTAANTPALNNDGGVLQFTGDTAE